METLINKNTQTPHTYTRTQRRREEDMTEFTTPSEIKHITTYREPLQIVLARKRELDKNKERKRWNGWPKNVHILQQEEDV